MLADGLMQLVRRQVACDWTRGVPARERESRILGEVAAHASQRGVIRQRFRSSCRTAGLERGATSRAQRRAHRDRRRELEDRLSIVAEIEKSAAAGKARPVDCLICVPHTEVEKLDGGVRRSRIGSELLAAGIPIWDASDATIRTLPPASVDSRRIIQYDSCRGPQGWAVLLMALDDLFANKLKHPNLHDGDNDVDVDMAARRWLLIPPTRAVHLLVIHVRDPH